MTILPITYLGGVEWFAHLSRASAGSPAIIDVGENWVKQTARNRCEIMTSGGAATLTVPVHGGSLGGPDLSKIQTKDVRIDNSRRWRHVHWTSLASAYRNSPFFDHYEERFAKVFGRKFEFLIELNFELLSVLSAALDLDVSSIPVSETWVEAQPADIDLRGKKALRRGQNIFTQEQEYTQVFSDRMPFEPNLSVIDLLFNEGPMALNFL